MKQGVEEIYAQFKALARIPIKPIAAICRALFGGSLTYPEFGSQTVDMDDISLAQSLINKPETWLDEGPIRKYEKRFSEWNGSLGACAFMGGRIALSALISAFQLKPGDEVVIPGYTCVVVANAFLYAGIKINYCDIELDSFGPDVNSVERAISSSTKVILIQHLYGLVARDLEKILSLARSKNIHVIEDCAHSAGASLNGRKVGNFGDAAFYSTEQSKIFSTFNGGIAVTNNPDILARIENYRAQAKFPSETQTKKLLLNFILSYQIYSDSWRWLTSAYLRYRYRNIILQSTTPEEIAGVKPDDYGQKMPAPLAELALSQLEKIDFNNQMRRENANYWEKVCKKKGFKTPLVIKGSVPVYLRFPVIVSANHKCDIRWGMQEFGVRQGVWFKGELHPTASLMENCPNARLAVEQCINLPTLGFNV